MTAATMIRHSIPSFATDDDRWEAIRRRDQRADDSFYYAVRTTGVYCRPSCPSRQARRENVSFHDSLLDAERAGFRPCRRCRPNEPSPQQLHAVAVAEACRMIETYDQPPSLQELAEATGWSRFHFHRIFKSITGLTPKAYASAHRARRIREQLSSPNATVTDAIYNAGFNSNAPFYAESARRLGMPPTRFQRRGQGETIRFALGECSLGSILVAATEKGICSILLGEDPQSLLDDLQARFANAELVGGEEDFEQMVARVVAMIERPGLGHDLPLDIRGTAFQQRVWRALCDIPAGKTATYGEIARQLEQPMATRAVAGACAANPLAVAIPCHRVVRRDGSASGYRWGIERKAELLKREAANDIQLTTLASHEKGRVP